MGLLAAAFALLRTLVGTQWALAATASGLGVALGAVLLLAARASRNPPP